MYRLWQKCVQIIKWPQCLRFKSVEEVFKNPHKTTFADFFCVDFMKFRGESVETRVKNPHKTHFTFQKRVKRGKSKRLETLVYKKNTRFPHLHTFQNVFGRVSLQKYFRSLFVEKGRKSIINVGIQQ